ncbi:MAG: tRNA (adenosine(37)-N6)-threonylcarbamoyltransferase complex dimerization subunit type 1 TsaB [Spirochaetales bacterium]|nr:tRNA (adenosine(37)-N6)-threonylcarbamoyltransferase complex dimerization subunit type 1 TsaB [Spirochaetales bacterium]
MNTLAFDTSGSFLSIGLKTETGFYEENRSAELRHSEHLLPAVERLMNTAGIEFSNLDLIVCSKGPGSFTGLRIGMSTAKGLAAANGTPIVSVSSLDILARGLSFFNGAVVPVIDARKKRFYSAIYYCGEKQTDYLDISTPDLAAMLKDYSRVLFTGPDCGIFLHNLQSAYYNFSVEQYRPVQGLSLVMIEHGESIFSEKGADREDSGPLYIRLSDAEIIHNEKKSE